MSSHATPNVSPAVTAPPGGAASVPTPPAESAASARAFPRSRRILVDAIVGVATVLLVVGAFSVWANRLLFSPDNWANTSTQLLANPTIRATTANYIVDQIYANVNVPALLQSGLPRQLDALAGPAAGALHTAAVQAVDTALQQPRVQALWAQANRATDELFISIVNGGRGPVGVANGAVTLDLGAIVDNVATRLGLPSDLSSRLPANIAHLTVFQSDHLKFVQNVGQAIQGLALWLTILVPLLYAAAVALARGHRRRTLMTVGFAGIVGGLLVVLGREILQNQLASALTNDASLRPTIDAVILINTAILGQVAGAIIAGGLVLVAAAWIGGPAKAAVASRRAIAPFLRDHEIAPYAITVAIMALIFIWNPIHATGTPAGIIVFTALALFGTFVLRRETAAEFPGAVAGGTLDGLRARLSDMRRPHRADDAPPPEHATAPVPPAPAPPPRSSSAPWPTCATATRSRPRNMTPPRPSSCTTSPTATAPPGPAAAVPTAHEMLRRLSDGDERSLAAVVSAAPQWAGERGTGLDRPTRVLVELAALLVADAPTTSVRWAVERAAANGVDDEELLGVLLVAGAATGGAQTVTSAPRLALALDLDTGVEAD